MEKERSIYINLEEAKKLFASGFKDIALKAYPINQLFTYKEVVSYHLACIVVANYIAKKNNTTYITEYSKLYKETNPIVRLSIINRALHNNNEDIEYNVRHFYPIYNKETNFKNVLVKEEPSLLDQKVFGCETEAIAYHMIKYFSDDMVKAENYLLSL